MRTLKQAGQQAALVSTLESLSIDVCCLSETRLYDSSTVVRLTAPSISSQYFLRCSGDPAATATGHAGVGIVLNSRAEASLLEWIPVNSRICAVRLATYVGSESRSEKKRFLSVIAAYAPTNCSPDDVKENFFGELSTLLRSSKSSDIIFLAGDLNAQLGRLDSSESELGGVYGLDGQRTDNGERLLHLCAEHKLFISSTAFRHKRRQCATWRPPSVSQPWTQIDHIAVSARWKGFIEACRSYWNTCVDSDHAFV